MAALDHEKGFQPSNGQNESQEGHERRDVSSPIDQDPETEPEPVVAFKTWIVAFVCHPCSQLDA